VYYRLPLGETSVWVPGQTKAVSVHIDLSQASISVGLVSPSECTMAQFKCDFTEQLWQSGKTEPRVPRGTST